MGMDVDGLGGIGIYVSIDELVENFDLSDDQKEGVEYYIKENFKSDIFYVESYGSSYEEDGIEYCILVNDPFKEGIDNIPKRIKKFIFELNNYNFDIKEENIKMIIEELWW